MAGLGSGRDRLDRRGVVVGVSGRVDVCLVAMPYCHIARPSIALGLLKAALEAGGIRCAVRYANLHFAERLGLDLLGRLSLHMRPDDLMGEWTFSRAAFPEHPTVPAAALLAGSRRHRPPGLPRWSEPPDMAGVYEHVQALAPAFVDETARAILERTPRIVGCTSTFEQHAASLALLRRVKALDPSVITLLGGANCEAEMGWATLRAFPWIDFVVSGEADELITPLCRRLLEGGTAVALRELPHGVMGRAHVREEAFGPGRAPIPRAVVERLDDTAIPDYTEYFAALEGSPLRPHIEPGLVIESSRGCWWGQKSQCTFCGLNGTGMSYRAKRPDRVLAELAELAGRYGVKSFQTVDNILDMQHLRTVIPELARRGAPYRLFYEIKSNLRRDQVGLLAEAGITAVQPGIEGLHDDFLKLMAKGNSAAVNVQLLKYAREFGIHVSWLLLARFPGEDDRWHHEVAAWLPLLAHLQPPLSVVSLRFDRFGVYHQRPERFGLDLVPYPAYAAVYPMAPEQLAELAYFFVDARDGRPGEPTSGAEALGGAVADWRGAFAREPRPVLCMTDADDTIEILDTRPCAMARRATLQGLEAAVYRACEPAITGAELARRLGGAVEGALARLIAQKLLLSLHGRYLALAVAGDVPTPPDADELPGGHIRRFR